MPTLGAPLDFAKLEGRNFQAHQLGTPPTSPVKGQLYYNTGDNTLYWFDGTAWVSGRGGTIPAHHTTHEPGGSDPLTVDAVVSTGSLRTLGAGAQQAMPGNRTLDAITIPAADMNFNTKRLTAVAAPQVNSDAATKAYVDSVAQGLDAKQSVRCATTANIDLSAAHPTSFDGVSPANLDRILVKDQTNPAENGIYTYAAAGPLARTSDMDAWAEVPSAYVWVEEGTSQRDTGWTATADSGGTLGTTPIPWTQFSGAGSITAGAGLTKSGNTIDVGAGSGILVAADSISVDSAVMPRYYSSATHAAGTTIAIPQSVHGCRASRGLIVMTVVEASGAEVLGDVVVAANGDVTVAFAASQAANTIRTTIIG